MLYFVSIFKVSLWTILISPLKCTEDIKVTVPDVGLVSSFLEQFIKPYIESMKLSNKSPRAIDETAMEKIIKQKVAELRPYLQDNDDSDNQKTENENNITLEGNEETTIIEFVPKKKKRDKTPLRDSKNEDSFHNNINKYKQLKKDIVVMLDKENTASLTKKLITRTLDAMIAQLIERQCTWNNGSTNLRRHMSKGPKNTRKSMSHLNKLSDEEWMNLRRQYIKFLEFNTGREDEFMRQFHDFFSNVINETWNLSNKYKVRCNLVKIDNNIEGNDEPFLRHDKDDIQCKTFKICSDELREFLISFYTSVNDTAVSSIKNYAAMYVRDVKADVTQDKDIVVSVLDNISNAAESKVYKIFKKAVQKFTLDKRKNKGANIKYLTTFIVDTTGNTNSILKKNLENELSAMKSRLFANVMEDITVNLRVDLENLRELYRQKICGLFVACNGGYSARRIDDKWMFRPRNAENTYVKVQLTLDAEMKDHLAQMASQRPLFARYSTTHNGLTGYYNGRKLMYKNISVSRTTIQTTTLMSLNNSTVKTHFPLKQITEEDLEANEV